jgi:hypothetical protein
MVVMGKALLYILYLGSEKKTELQPTTSLSFKHTHIVLLFLFPRFATLVEN